MPLPSEVQYKVATDPEATQSSISIVRKRPRQPQDRVADYRRNLVNQLVYQMINDRFDEISRKADAPFLSAGAYGGGLSPTVETVTLGAGVQDGKIEAGLAAVALEAKRVTQFGFGAAELDRAKKWTLAGTTARTPTRQDRERLLRPGIREPLPRGRTEPGYRLRARSGREGHPGDLR